MENNHTEQINELIKKLENELVKYEASIGLPNIESYAQDTQVSQLLNGEIDTSKITEDEASTLALKVANFSFSLQRKINREMTRINFLENKIWAQVNKRISQQVGATRDDRYKQAIQENQLAQKMHDIQQILNRRVQRISFLANKLESQKDILLEISRLRRRNSHG